MELSAVDTFAERFSRMKAAAGGIRQSWRFVCGTMRTEPGENSDGVSPQAGFFYGWWIVLAGTAIFVVSSGIGFYGHGVFLDPIRTLHGWSKASVSIAITLYFFTAGVSGIVVGRQVDKFGPTRLLVSGSLVVGIAFLLLSRIHTLWQLYTVYFLMAIGWSGTSVIPVNALIMNWFVLKRGQAMSLVMTGLSVGGIVMVPLAAFLISRWGLKVALPILGAMFWTVVIPLAVFVIKQRPSDIGQFPDGLSASSSLDRTGVGHLSYESQMRKWTGREAMGTVTFWAIVVAFFLAMTCQVSYLVHQVSFLSAYLGFAGAAMAVSITAAASIVGRLSMGVFIDRLDKRHVTIGLLILQAIAVLGLAYSNHLAVLYLGTMAFGLTMGCIVMMQSLIIGECFGMRSFATVSGLAGVFVQVGAAIGPTIAGMIYDATQSYRIAFTIFAAASVLAMFAIVFAKPPGPEEKSAAP
jgi:MFS family permease